MIDAIRDALDACTVLNLAYVDEDGPQVCAVFYAPTRDGDMVFVSSRSTRHGRALASDPDGVPVAFTVQDDDQSWRTLRGVQGRGVCGALRAPTWTAPKPPTPHGPFVADDAQLARALAAADHWCVRPTWLRAIDNSRGFGHKTEWPGEG